MRYGIKHHHRREWDPEAESGEKAVMLYIMNTSGGKNKQKKFYTIFCYPYVWALPINLKKMRNFNNVTISTLVLHEMFLGDNIFI